MVAPLKLGMIGISEGNGHPYSFAAIVNGYDDAAMQNSGWDVIYRYLRTRDRSEFGFDDVQVTHAWTQDPDETARLAAAARIPHPVASAHEMLDAVDAVIIARDDYQTHYALAKPFLEHGKYVFVDKPLSLDVDELRFFRSYLHSGRLMSCSGARYARELDDIRANLAAFGTPKLIRGTVVNSLEKYGIHMLDGIFGVTGCLAKSVSCRTARHTSLRIENTDGSLVCIDALGQSAKTLQFDFWSDTSRFHAETNDNFTMFRRLLADFIRMVRSGRPSVAPTLVLDTMRVLIAARMASLEHREVELDEIAI